MADIRRIALISDLHLDHWKRYYEQSPKECYHSYEGLFSLIMDKCKKVEPDLIVLAGDFSNGEDIHRIIDESDIPVIYVLGNHDYYGQEWPLDVTFQYHEDYAIGATLWTNFHNVDDYHSRLIYNQITDSRAIRGTSVRNVKNAFDETWQKLIKSGREIVVTHFPISIKSISEKYTKEFTNPYFVNNMEDAFLSENQSIKLWMFGHVHHRHSYYIGGTLFACNPLGYPRENFKTIRDYEPMVIEKQDNGDWEVL